MPQDFHSFNASDIQEFSKIMLDVDKNALRVLQMHAFLDVRFDVIINTLNENDPDFLTAFATLHPKGDSVYLKDVGFRIPSSNFTSKLNVFSSLGLLGKETISALAVLNTLRNACAHDFKKRITKHDVAALSSKLASNSKLKELFLDGVSDENLEKRLCSCLFWLFMDVIMSLEKIEILKNVMQDHFKQ